MDRYNQSNLLIESFEDVLPREIWDRKKQGFVLPFANWMKGRNLTESGKLSVLKTSLHRRFNAGKLSWSRYWAYHLASMSLTPPSAHTNVEVTGSPEQSGIDHLGSATANRQPKTRILFLTLTTFSHAGGIEKFNRCFLKALRQLEREGDLTSHSSTPYDDIPDERYYDTGNFTGFNGKRTLFILDAVRRASRFDHVIIGHLNLAPVGYLIKKLYPGKRITLVTHGIEVWEPVSGIKRKLLQEVDEILSVSNFTREKLMSVHQIPPAKITVFPNTIDPYFPVPGEFGKKLQLRKQLGIAAEAPVMFTLSRLSGKEKYKGYDSVIECIPELRKAFPSIKYIIAGKYDPSEKSRLDNITASLNVKDQVILTGFSC